MTLQIREWQLLFFSLFSRPGNTWAKSGDFREDGIRRSGPDKTSLFAVVVLHEIVDLLHKFLHPAERTPPNGSQIPFIFEFSFMPTSVRFPETQGRTVSYSAMEKMGFKRACMYQAASTELTHPSCSCMGRIR
jgi:hypothetical protein